MVNVARNRNSSQISTSEFFFAENAVDGGKKSLLREHSCAQTKKETDPWWRVDLGKSVWVESVLIASRTDPKSKQLSNVEIRIGKTSNHWFKMLCIVWFTHVPQTTRRSEG